MLKTLRLSHLVLVDHADIPFAMGFNVLTGETGSGKSAILQALSMIQGARADTGLIRHEEERAVVEATFEIDDHSSLLPLLEDHGIRHDLGEELIIRREIHKSGKSRSFINNQQVQVGILKTIGERLLEIVGQHANRRLMAEGSHRDLLDLFASTGEIKTSFRRTWQECLSLKKQLQELSENEAQRLREIEICRMELEELDRAAIRPGEEEELFAEYTRLTHSEELAKTAFEVSHKLAETEHALLPGLRHLHHLLETMSKTDSSLQDTAGACRSALLELQEVARTIEHYHSSIESNPHRLAEINARLTVINQMKRKYGPTMADLLDYQKKKGERLELLESFDQSSEQIEQQLQVLVLEADRLARELTVLRTQSAKELEQAMKEQLELLNMPRATFEVLLHREVRSLYGDESVSFFFSPNLGEKKVSIRECASGGELSRILLALQTLLAGKEQISTLIFDEIDANIGGETATVIGQKLQELGNSHQILCVTHFPQVAKCARHHIRISKQEKKGRTYTETKVLNEDGRKSELSRMSGQGSVQPRAVRRNQKGANHL